MTRTDDQARSGIGIDPGKASVAGVYDALLGGKYNYAVDRVVRDAMLDVVPGFDTVIRDDRAWLARVTRFLVGVGIEQIVDCACGLPAAENTHDVALRRNGDAKTVYVDSDPVVAAHGKAWLEDKQHAFFGECAITEPEKLLGKGAVARHLDLSQPIGLLFVSALHHVPDATDPVALMHAYVDALPSGSYLAITHFLDPEDGGELSDLARRLQKVTAEGTMGSGWFRTRERIEALFAELPLIAPGLTFLPRWWPDGPAMSPLLPAQRLMLGGVARKP
ncbi:hypothetical protein BAY61_29565 [Prauserella marina]|uniref:S-adenosyl methyltransferase n=1 Tax=Prauserella marina TaxID=530584 RepID=A0A222VXR3_9PSEU|nr:SAM-dependent methyltransferase [Prauserella marina]ASR38463.1 hypothetical protein BAY61_29565 [Prauserella marina]PWV78293.1 S-adenosyl methyltransferase [Prauserella marina]SDC82745.1 S-adenosyl methyltransferase [Prauserella marina]